MPAFNYIALKSDGTTQKGVIEADGVKQARQLLRNQNLTPLELHQVHANKANLANYFRLSRKYISLLELSLITRQLATLLSAALPVEEALSGVGEQSEKKYIKSIIYSVRAKIMEGHSLAASLRHHPEVFPELYCATVGSGEQTGKLDMILTRLADYIEKQVHMRQKIMQALIYPMVMLAVAIGIVSFLLAYVVPKIIDVFMSGGQNLPEITRVLLALSYFIGHFGIYLLLLFIMMFYLMKRLLRDENLRKRYHQFLLHIPLLNYMIRTINTARYARTLGILYAAGVSILEAMRVANSLITNLTMREAIAAASIKVREGTNINVALKQTGYFTPMSIHLIASGEASGQLEQMLERAANNQEEAVTRTIAMGLTLFEPLIILVMGALVLFIVLALLLPIFQIDQLVG